MYIYTYSIPERKPAIQKKLNLKYTTVCYMSILQISLNCQALRMKLSRLQLYTIIYYPQYLTKVCSVLYKCTFSTDLTDQSPSIKHPVKYVITLCHTMSIINSQYHWRCLEFQFYNLLYNNMLAVINVRSKETAVILLHCVSWRKQ